MSAPTSPRAHSRRRLLSRLSVLLGAAATALAGVPVLGFVFAPVRRPPDGRAKGFVWASALVDLPAGFPKRVELIDTVVDAWNRTRGVVGAAFLLKQKDGSVTALSTVCPHSGCSIRLDGDQGYVCPCHDSAFDLSGKVLKGPSPRAMDALDVEVRESQAYCRYVRFKQGVTSREEA